MVKTVVGFMNRDGGTSIIGVDDAKNLGLAPNLAMRGMRDRRDGPTTRRTDTSTMQDLQGPRPRRRSQL